MEPTGVLLARPTSTFCSSQISHEQRSPRPAATAGYPPTSPIASVGCPTPSYPSPPAATVVSPRSPLAGPVGGPPLKQFQKMQL